MALIERNAPWRARRTFVTFKAARWLRNTLVRWIKTRKHPHVRDLTPRQARDAGIRDTDIAWHQLRLPSQHDHHPRS